MAVPSSGALSMLGIRRELGTNNYNSTTTYTNISLEDMSEGTNGTINTNNAAADRPDGSTPHAMSEFYNYDHDATSSVSSATYYFSSTAGNSCLSTSGVTVYWSGSGDALDQGHRIYTNSGLTTLATAGYYRSEEVDSNFGYSRLWSQTAGGTWFGSASYCGV